MHPGSWLFIFIGTLLLLGSICIRQKTAEEIIKMDGLAFGTHLLSSVVKLIWKRTPWYVVNVTFALQSLFMYGIAIFISII